MGLPGLVLCAVLVSTGCSGRVQAERARVAAVSQQAEELVRQDRMPLIGRATLREVVHGGGAVAVVRVIKTELRLRGTRSESVSIDAEVRQSLYGHLGDTVNMRRYTRRGDLVLKPGQFYVVALRVEPRYAPGFALEDFVEVPPEAIEASAAKHRQAIAEVSH